jgi:hypothetical protein
MCGAFLMTKRKKISQDDQFFGTSVAPPAHIFRAGDVVSILGIERWRLEKFITGTQYKLTPSGHLGEGKGSWRLFSLEDMYRLGIATRMVEDGFTAKFISFVLQEIEDADLLVLDMEGNSNAPEVGIFRRPKGPIVHPFFSNEKERPYYVLPLSELLNDINKRIYKLRRK